MLAGSGIVGLVPLDHLVQIHSQCCHSLSQGEQLPGVFDIGVTERPYFFSQQGGEQFVKGSGVGYN